MDCSGLWWIVLYFTEQKFLVRTRPALCAQDSEGVLCESLVRVLYGYLCRSCTTSIVLGLAQTILFFLIGGGMGGSRVCGPAAPAKIVKIISSSTAQGQQSVSQNRMGSPKSCAKPCASSFTGLVRALEAQCPSGLRQKSSKVDPKREQKGADWNN